MTIDDVLFRPIGTIQTDFRQKFATPRQAGLAPSSRGLIQLYPDRVPPGSFDGLEDFSHLWLVYLFHQNRPGNSQGKIKPPMLEGARKGWLATRSPHRPNAIGLSAVRLLSLDPGKFQIEVSGVDCVDGTPILDIKPYVASYDLIGDANSGWLEHIGPPKKFRVEWSHKADKTSLELDDISLIEEVLCSDIRNRADKKTNSPVQIFRTRLRDWDVHFRIAQDQVFIEELVRLD